MSKFSKKTKDLKSKTLTENEIRPESGWAETSDSTILDAMMALTDDVRYDQQARRTQMQVDTTDNAATRYLMRRLNMSSRQVQILSCILYINQTSSQPCDAEDLALALDLHPFEVLALKGDILELAQNGYLYPSNVRNMEVCFGSWSISTDAMKALSENHALDRESLRNEDSLSFLNDCLRLINRCLNDEGRNLGLFLEWLMRFNEHLPIVQNVRRICGGDELSLKILLHMAANQAIEGYTRIPFQALDEVMDELTSRRTVRAFQKGTHPLVREGIIEPWNADGMANADEWTISRKGWAELVSPNTDEVNLLINESTGPKRNILEHDKIAQRALFFSGETEEAVNRLRRMLNGDHYQTIVARMKESNYPTGFNILLYGTPGTGKTELVQQLARETERDLFIVDMSQIRDKWVGESEQNLARVFSAYRESVARSKRTPILFCNECDAIFGARLENTQSAVDKMENALQNILLEQMEKMEGIMICTTNLTSSLDKAFERRFLVKLQLLRPNLQAREQIWHEMMPSLTDEQRTLLAQKYSFSGGQIQNIARKHLINVILDGEDGVDFASILEDCNAETMDRSNGHRIGF